MSIHQQSHPGSSIAWRNAPTKGVDVGGTKLVYRQLGPDTGVSVIFLNHLAAELDRWDPRVVDGIATRRRVIVFDNQGVGASEGKTRSGRFVKRGGQRTLSTSPGSPRASEYQL